MLCACANGKEMDLEVVLPTTLKMYRSNGDQLGTYSQSYTGRLGQATGKLLHGALGSCAFSARDEWRHVKEMTILEEDLRKEMKDCDDAPS